MKIKDLINRFVTFDSELFPFNNSENKYGKIEKPTSGADNGLWIKIMSGPDKDASIIRLIDEIILLSQDEELLLILADI